MGNTKKWSEIRRTKVSPDQEPLAAERLRAMRDAIALTTLGEAWVDIDLPALQASLAGSTFGSALAKVRSTLGVTQVELAGRLGIQQSSVSELERRDEVYVSTLRDYVEALGGRLQVAAVFPDDAPEPRLAGSGPNLTKGRV